MEGAEILSKIAEEIRTCEECDLHRSRVNAVPGEGPSDAEIMFVGEAPGYHESQQGKPFVGVAGKNLDKLLDTVGLEREQVFIGNILKCRPPNNRDPTNEEIEACSTYLERQVRTIKPKLIVSLGRFATRVLLGKPVSVGKTHGKLIDCSYGGWNCKLFVSYHPAAALYGADAERNLERDFKKLKKIAKELDRFKGSQQMTL